MDDNQKSYLVYQLLIIYSSLVTGGKERKERDDGCKRLKIFDISVIMEDDVTIPK